MTMDGSFQLEVELRRLVYRCPRLASVSEFDYLLKKGEKVTDDEVVQSVGELVLHPSYTIPVLGCFRSISDKIIARTVSLLKLVPDLSQNSEDFMTEFDDDKYLSEREVFNNSEILHVVDVHVRSGKGLSLHELACLAFCRAIDLIPSLLRCVLDYFKFARPPFQRFKSGDTIFSKPAVGGSRLLHVTRVSYRFLLAKPEVFTSLWDWSCFLDLLQQFEDDDMDIDLKTTGFDIRWCTIQILAVVLKSNDKASSSFRLDSGEAFTCLLRWHGFCQDVSLEKAGWYLESSGVGEVDMHGDLNIPDLNKHSQLASLDSSTSCSDTEMRSWNVTRCSRNPFVLTSILRKIFEMVSLAVNQRWPVLLYGPASAGKTAIIKKLALDHGNQVLSLQMDDQIDGKALLGNYVCTEIPGEFRWQPGILVQAVSKGFWVVFEDLDKAPSDVQSILLPLLDGGSTFVTCHGEVIKVHEGFRLFSTVTSSKLDISSLPEGKLFLGGHWRKVMIRPPRDEDLLSVVTIWYPELEPLAEKLLETYRRVNELAGFPLGANVLSSAHGRFSLRTLLKWCKRIAGLGLTFDGVRLSSLACSNIYREAVDVFAAFLCSAEVRLTFMKEIARLWTVSDVDSLYPVNKPVIQDFKSELQVGRVILHRTQMAGGHVKNPFVEIRSSVHLLERIACSIKFNEPVLLVGETGTGKTTLIQSLAARLGQKLTVLNLSQQTDVADLLGGFRPIDAKFVLFPLYNEFERLFTASFSEKDNKEFLVHMRNYVCDKKWKKLLSGFQKGVRMTNDIGRSGSGAKRKRPLGEELQGLWTKFSLKMDKAEKLVNASGEMIFSFVEGAFVTALKNGEWILLDEVNLAPPETLQRVNAVLEEEHGSLCLAEKGDIDYIFRHPNFRIFACMNPATDAGKRDLPCALRSRFTEYFVDDVMDDDDLVLFIRQYIDDPSNRELVSKILRFYKAAKKESDERLQDGANQKPHYSLRSLYRALEYYRKAKRKFIEENRKFDPQKALYDGFCMFFLTLLDENSAKLMNQLIISHLLGGKMPAHVPFDDYLFDKRKPQLDPLLERYVLTKSVKENLASLARAIFVGRSPVLLQGPTSSGKTSLVQYLASLTGHEFIRINNHEHTDLQEYLGTYITDSSGKLVFQEGPLVRAVRDGSWIVLDELNLAPSDVLEALNRLLDDNRELFVPERNELISAHSDFMLFATQNPPNLYGGRKILSRAFRNRFVEIHVDEIPQNELSTILEKRCSIPVSYAKKMIDVMKELQLQRQSSQVFAGKQGYITPRDLFRWAGRFRKYGSSYEDLARDGYYLLAERLRDKDEKKVIQHVIEKHMRVKLAENDMYQLEAKDGSNIIWTRSMQKLYFLVERCFEMREPVLLIGETGGGKTTVCQLLSAVRGSRLHILNCHQYTETSDFLGGFYPIRERSKISADYKSLCQKFLDSNAIINFPDLSGMSPDINQASLMLEKLSEMSPDVGIEDRACINEVKSNLKMLYNNWKSIFLWQDGPLVDAMKNGDFFLVDEISLADDSVLERLNSVLEPERKLALAEKGGSDLEVITAHENFFLLATMNPGSDYGKKELSPALRNRFTEIWVPSVDDLDELKSIGLGRILNPQPHGIVHVMLKFWEWFNHLGIGRMLTVRDLLSWVSFVNVTEKPLQTEFSILHGLFLVLLDGLTLGTHLSRSMAMQLRKQCLSFLVGQLQELYPNLRDSKLSTLPYFGWGDNENSADSLFDDGCGSMHRDNSFGIHPFYIERGDDCYDETGFRFFAPTTCRNALRVLRAMQLAKPVLLEGSPGVGKTSLVVAIGKFSGHKVVRINLSEQTDIMDLLGSDLPVDSDEGMQFAWSDGILLQALKKGLWVLLDELNLAPQSVLEGLNAILDHRAEVFIPELGRTFKCPVSFRVFACQNPSSQGGGRKGLPKSFLNRFTKVYVDELVEDDLNSICSSMFPEINASVLLKLVLFNKRLHEEIMIKHRFAQDGFPWEFNLRDVIRSCQIIKGAPEKENVDCFLNPIYVQRMRTKEDRLEVLKLYEEIFGCKPRINPFPRVQLNPRHLIVGNTSIERNSYQACGLLDCQHKILPGQLNNLEAITHCVKHQWLCILVGPSSSGKTSLIRLLSELTGNMLHELNLSSATDISELLGCFEQHNAVRSYNHVISQVQRYMNEYCSHQLESSCQEFVKRKSLIAKWLAFLSSVGHDSEKNSSGTNLETSRGSSPARLVDFIEELRSVLEENTKLVSWSSRDLDAILSFIQKLEESYSRRQYSAKFEWVAGVLLKAIENGEWIILENANLCNPTVLDRINSLVEQSGSITVNECGTVDGEPMILCPHPKFRMFLTVNPSFGEVSRAMRNRGVEVFLMHPSWFLENIVDDDYEEAELRDVKRFISLSGIPFGNLVNMMATSHMYAKRQAAVFHGSITFLELARWIQLFSQLISNGNRPFWSLKISWEHTYLSSLGEEKGKDIIAQTASLYLSELELKRIEYFQDSLACLPGGWPTPLTTREFVIYSKESSVRQICMYLQFLGAQNALFRRHQSLDAPAAGEVHMIDMSRVYLMMFPRASTVIPPHAAVQKQSKVEVSQRLLYAATWTLEQAMESDIELYQCWFRWFGSQLKPFCSFFNVFVDTLENDVMKHPIWKEIIRCRADLLRNSVNSEAHPLPILSVDLLDLSAMDNVQGSRDQRLICLIKSVCLLMLSYLQWRSEKESFSSGKCKYESILKALRAAEEKVLLLLVTSADFDLLYDLYNDLLGYHKLFWECVISTNNDAIIVSSLYLLKNAMKFKDFCPKEIGFFLREVNNADSHMSRLLRTEESLLWLHGGHPYVSHSGEIYYKQCQLLNLCNPVWPRKNKNWEGTGSDMHKNFVLSLNPDLRSLAMEGVSMFSYLISKSDEDDLFVVEQLEEMYQKLFQRFEHEKQILEANIRDSMRTLPPSDLSVCCTYPPNLLCSESGVFCMIQQLPILDDTSFYLDMVLLRELSQVVLVSIEEKYHLLSGLTGLLDNAMKFSLNSCSRPPTDLSAHQKILWTIDAWESVTGIDDKISVFLLEMWFRWHSFLWMQHSDPSVDTSTRDVLLPEKLFRSPKTLAVEKILSGASDVRGYSLHAMKIRAAVQNLWQGSCSAVAVENILKDVARSLFQHIINAHEISFEGDTFDTIKSFFILSATKGVTQNDIAKMISLLLSSNHETFKFLCKPLICPLLAELYMPPSTDSLFSLGCIWLRIGCLRYKLVMWPDDVDPVAKYSVRYSHVTGKIDSLKLEMEVRQECVRLAGSFRAYEGVSDRCKMLQNLEAERKRLRRQIVYRADPGKYMKLKNLCLEFCGFSDSWIKDVERMDVEQMINHVKNWQAIATYFIESLSSEEYSEYTDLVEPLQVAIYEMKLGMSFILSSAISKNSLVVRGLQDIDTVLDTVYSFMRFPRGVSSEVASVHIDSQQDTLTSYYIKLPSRIGSLNLKLLEKLCASPRVSSDDKTASLLQFKTTIYRNVILQVVQTIAQSRLLDNASFSLLDNIFDEFANFWMEMKIQSKLKEESDARQFKFRPRVFKIETIMEVDISSLGNSIENSTFLEWQEMTVDEGNTEEENVNEVHGSLDDEWNSIEGSVLNTAVDIHNRLFGSSDLFHIPGNFQVSDAEILSAFSDSYKLGVGIIKDFDGLVCSFDAKLIPEHILCLSLEHEKRFVSPCESGHMYKFYKDSNAPMMAKIVVPLVDLKQRMLVLLKEWDDHPAIQKILEVIEMVLDIPVCTPLAKALSGLQFLLNKFYVLQETVAKFPLSDCLKPIYALVSAWHKLEFQSWPSLLDEVQDQFELNAGRLWFPLYPVLMHPQDYTKNTIESLDEFIHMSSIGEFRRRLQLLLAFHRHISSGLCHLSYPSPWHVENVKILYNTFGFYVQFLPMVMEQIASNRKKIEEELDSHKKLCRWEDNEYFHSMENTRKVRQKLKKIIQKYNDALKQPVTLIITQEVARRGVSHQSMQAPQLSNVDSGEKGRNLLNTVAKEAKLKEDRLSRFDDQKKMEVVSLALQHVQTIEVDVSYFPFEDISDVVGVIKNIEPSQCSVLLRRGNQIWVTMTDICENIIGCDEIWRDEKKHLQNRRMALASLLNLLENCGLSKHRAMLVEDNLDIISSRNWLLQPSYEVKHLLLRKGSSSDHIDSNSLCNISSSSESLNWNWRIANEFYFKSVASMHVMQQICLNFHKHFTLEQVQRSSSFLDHLISIQQEQRAAAYDFEEKIKNLRNFLWPLGNIVSFSQTHVDTDNSHISFTPNHLIVLECMWQQKHLLDNLCTMLHEVHLLLNTFELNHLNSCSTSKNGLEKIQSSIGKFIPEFQHSKDLLDTHLLGQDRDISNAGDFLLPYGVTKEMENFVNDNFQTIRNFKESVEIIRREDKYGETIKTAILGHFDDLFAKARFLDAKFTSDLRARNHQALHGASSTTLEADYRVSIKESYQCILIALNGVLFEKNGPTYSEESSRKIIEWKSLFGLDVFGSSLNHIVNTCLRTTTLAVELLSDPKQSSLVGAHLRHLYALLSVILDLSEGLLCDFLVMHRMVSITTHVLGDCLASLFGRGFGFLEDEVDDLGNETKQDAIGIGMGKGIGLHDVSDQIENEDQLLGTSEKPDEQQDDKGDADKNEKGIEMDQDFTADAVTVSQESEDDEEEEEEDKDAEEVQLESTMGDTGPDSETVDEKSLDKDSDENLNTKGEKYESGPSIKDTDDNKELRAKEDPSSTADETGEPCLEDNDFSNEDGCEASPDEVDDLQMNKEDAYSDPSGLKPDEPHQFSDEDVPMDEPKDLDSMEDGEGEETEDANDNEKGEDQTCPVEEEGFEPMAEDANTDNFEDNHDKDQGNDTVESRREYLQGGPDPIDDSMDALQSEEAINKSGSGGVTLGNIAQEEPLPNSYNRQNDFAPMNGLPDSSTAEIALGNSMNGRKHGDHESEAEQSTADPLVQKMKSNPCRSIGDALKGWKERVNVSVDLQDEMITGTDALADENTNEYGYTSQFENGTTQTLGHATADQIDKNVSGNDLDAETESTRMEDHEADMDIDHKPFESDTLRNFSSRNLANEMKKLSEELDSEKQQDEYKELGYHDHETTLSQSLLSINRTYLSEGISQLSTLSITENELGKALDLDEISTEMSENAATLWRRYELLTTRLSHELTEQLRLVMEPNLASKLQGDYKTGKRINMKKVIAYVASLYRKDKIWLRRTRPNKRDYQVVIAVDDSSSMQESRCGSFAIEALATVCSAMSQLEVGNLAIASFGKKGNIKLLHDFDEPFNGEVGIKIISNLTFKQENTIADEPMVDLLNYLINLMNKAAAHARLPSGQNPLQQLVLIIADGRFHEKESLKRRVRDIVNSRRMVAFLLLDSPEESIMDLMEATFEGGNVKFTKYLNSFPFPFYVVLKNIEALPKTLADLLRQWFELMQQSRG